MKFLQAIKKGIDQFGNYWSLLIIPLFLLPAFEAVVMRYTLKSPTIWSQELCCMIFGIWFVIGGAYGEANGAHVSMDIFYQNYRGVVKMIADTLSFLGCTILCFVLVWKGTGTFLNAFGIMQRTESLWAPVIWPNRLSIVLGAALLWIRTCFSYSEKMKESINYLREKKKGGDK